MKQNTQPAEKGFSTDGNSLEIVSIFSTIQGEGPFTGRRAIFIRLAGCNLQCPGCDTDYTSSRAKQPVLSIVDMVSRVAKENHLIVITGGEPFKQNISVLCRHLLDCTYQVQVETNGSMRPSPDLPKDVIVVCSPKTPRINKELAQRANAFKYVLHHSSISEDDGLPVNALYNGVTGEPVARPPEGYLGEIYLQPMDCYDDAENRLNIKSVVDSCIRHGYTLQLQVHKYVDVE